MIGKERKVAVITGGSKGIGAGLVAAYHDRGWAVVANARTIRSFDSRVVVAVEGDLLDPSTADLIVATGMSHFGHIDTLINNAGVYVSKPFTDYSADEYSLMVGLNLGGFFRLTQQVIPHMLQQGGGHIVNVSATVADVASSREPAVLAALTKGGLASATRSLAIEYASRGIRVNAVSPADIETPLHSVDSYEGLADSVPLKRLGKISDVVKGVLFLESSPYVTGEIVHIDGGQVAGH